VESLYDVSVVQGKSKAKKDQKSGNLAEKLMNLFGQVLEELGAQKQFENLTCETLMTMITFAGQNMKFKNCFVANINVSTQSKRVTILKIVCEKIQSMGNLQSNSRHLRLLFTLLRSLSLSADIAKEVMKLRFVEDITG